MIRRAGLGRRPAASPPHGVAQATLLPNGKVLVAGGFDTVDLASAELVRSRREGLGMHTGSLAMARSGFHTATLLPNGKVLVAGGDGQLGQHYLTSAELYDPASGIWSATGSLVIGRGFHTATLLPNDGVLIAAGAGYSGVLATAGTVLYMAQLDTAQPLLNSLPVPAC